VDCIGNHRTHGLGSQEWQMSDSGDQVMAHRCPILHILLAERSGARSPQSQSRMNAPLLGVGSALLL
jgi:hypothetical protein